MTKANGFVVSSAGVFLPSGWRRALIATMDRQVLITCEHGGNRVPARYRRLFRDQKELLESHRGWDPGALELARQFARQLQAPLVASQTTRLLVELNRSIGHPSHFSAITRPLDRTARQKLIDEEYLPYRRDVESRIEKWIGAGKYVCHLSMHTFTPVLDGQVRKADVGLLYDPARGAEREFCRLWQKELESILPGLVVRCNYPYRGSADGFTTTLRRQHPESVYSGIEVEVNQQWSRQPKRRTALGKALLGAFQSVVLQEAGAT